MTLPAPTRRPDAPDPAVRFRRGPEPGDRAGLVEALAELLVARAERRRERAAADVGGEDQDEAAGAPREGRP